MTGRVGSCVCAWMLVFSCASCSMRRFTWASPRSDPWYPPQRTAIARAQIIHTALVAIGTALPALCYSVLIGNWAHVFRTYKQRMLRMRRGVYFFDRKVYREESANQYVGYQVAGMTIASLSCKPLPPPKF